MAQAVEISKLEMVGFLSERGFSEVKLAGTREMVMGKVVGVNLCLRVYTSIVGESSRGVGEDAIRTVLVAKINGEVKIVGSDKRVHRVVGWKENLAKRIDNWGEMLGALCPLCGAHTVRKRARRYDFWGCSRFPVCRGSIPVEGVKPAVKSAAPVGKFVVPTDIMDGDV